MRYKFKFYRSNKNACNQIRSLLLDFQASLEIHFKTSVFTLYKPILMKCYRKSKLDFEMIMHTASKVIGVGF